MGHSSDIITSRDYPGLLDDTQRAAIEAVNRALENALGHAEGTKRANGQSKRRRTGR
jgi:hypothetical protein